MMPAAIRWQWRRRPSHVVEAGHDAARQLMGPEQAHRDLGDHGQHALAADHGGSRS